MATQKIFKKPNWSDEDVCVTLVSQLPALCWTQRKAQLLLDVQQKKSLERNDGSHVVRQEPKQSSGFVSVVHTIIIYEPYHTLKQSAQTLDRLHIYNTVINDFIYLLHNM